MSALIQCKYCKRGYFPDTEEHTFINSGRRLSQNGETDNKISICPYCKGKNENPELLVRI